MSIIVSLLLVFLAVAVQAPPVRGDLVAHRLADNVYALIAPDDAEDFGGNCGFVITDEGVVLIDAGMPGRQSQRIREELRKVTGQRIAVLILTHKHWDHTLGTALLADNETRIIAHDAAKGFLEQNMASTVARISRQGGPLADALARVEPRMPGEGLSMSRTLTVGGVRFELVHPGQAHTAGDLMVLLPAQKVLFGGDLMWSGIHPWAADTEVDLDGWRRALDRIIEMDVERIVPGHGEICGKDEARRLQAYLGDLHDQGLRAFREAIPAAEAAGRVQLPSAEGWTGVELLTRNLRTLYARLAATELEPPFTIALPPQFEITDGAGGPSRGWIRWGWRSPTGYRDFEVMWKPKVKDNLTEAEVRRDYQAWLAENPQYLMEETGARTLTVAGQTIPVLTGIWRFKENPDTGGPWQWMLLNLAGTQYAIQFGTNAGFDAAAEKENMAALEAMALTFEASPSGAE